MKAKKKIPKAVKETLAAIKFRGCFRCDGTRRICNICGESGRACQCEEEDFAECPDCKQEAK